LGKKWVRPVPVLGVRQVEPSAACDLQAVSPQAEKADARQRRSLKSPGARAFETRHPLHRKRESQRCVNGCETLRNRLHYAISANPTFLANAVNALIAASFRRNHANPRSIESGFESP
jgi:hypothetical protein